MISFKYSLSKVKGDHAKCMHLFPIMYYVVGKNACLVSKNARNRCHWEYVRTCMQTLTQCVYIYAFGHAKVCHRT